MVAAVLSFFVLLCVVVGARQYDRRMWNAGRCSSCEKRWKKFAVDSAGGRGYRCPCGRIVWISWGVDT